MITRLLVVFLLAAAMVGHNTKLISSRDLIGTRQTTAAIGRWYDCQRRTANTFVCVPVAGQQ